MQTDHGSVLYHGFLPVAASACDYFRPWTYDAPLVISRDTNDRLRRVQQLYMRCVRHFVEHFDRYRPLMPVSDRVLQILERVRYPYRLGTYRTDFVIDQRNAIKLIETTCRFALNGYFTSGFFHQIAHRLQADRPDVAWVDDYTPFYSALMDYFGPFDHVCLMKGADGRNETQYVVQVFESAGFPVHVIPSAEVAAHLHLFEGAAVIGELDHDELCGQPDATIDAIIAARPLNDLRTVFLLHDKRFFAVLHHDGFLHDALGDAGARELAPYLVPTYTKLLRPDVWARARGEKDRWILKPSVLGKSIDVYAGCVTDEAEWQALFDSGRADSMVLQSWVEQRRFRGTIGDEQRDDYVAGTLLFFDEGYFGPGLFRASSHPVTNKADDRKIAPLVTADVGAFDPAAVL
jgi:hypothetical protein